ncbi:MAG TPA: hypothetical protein VGM91_10700 [Conexibacter sp.]|jgi:hypothetical protein
MLQLGDGQLFRAKARRLLFVGGATACMFIAAATPAGARLVPDPGAGRGNPRALRLETIGIGLINRVVKDVRHAHPECVPDSPFDDPTTVTDASPSDALLAAFAPLRRPATPDDTLPMDVTTMHLPAGPIYTNSIRLLHGPGGHDFYLIVAQGRFVPRPEPRLCLRLQRRELEDKLADRSSALRRMTLHTFDQVNGSEHPLHPPKPAEAVYLFDRTPSGQIGGGGGGVDLAFIRNHGMVGTSGTRGSSQVTVLVPDGVASITATFARTVPHGKYRAPKVYPRAITMKVPVQDNIASFTAARPAPDAFPTQMVWQAADGSIVKTVRGNR